MAEPKRAAKTYNAQDLMSMSTQQLMTVKNSFKTLVTKEGEILRNKIQTYQTQMPNLMAGNLDDVNKIIWPFIFTTQIGQDNADVAIPPANSRSGFISITQEASFVCLKMAKTVFVKQNAVSPFLYNYIDPLDFDAGLATNLKYVINDSQSTRTFHQLPMDIDHLGHGQKPYVLRDPLFFSENNNIEVKFFNDDAAITYMPFVTFFGYRVRVQDAQEIFSLLKAD